MTTTGTPLEHRTNKISFATFGFCSLTLISQSKTMIKHSLADKVQGQGTKFLCRSIPPVCH